MTQAKTIRKPTLMEAISCFIAMVIIIGVGKGILKLDIQPLLILAAFYAAIIGRRLGYSYQEMEKGITENLATSLPVIYFDLCWHCYWYLDLFWYSSIFDLSRFKID